MDEVWKRDEIESPCVNICLIDPTTKLCLGCGRTSSEIAGWSQFSPKERTELMSKLPQRMNQQQRTRKGGRKRNR